MNNKLIMRLDQSNHSSIDEPINLFIDRSFLAQASTRKAQALGFRKCVKTLAYSVPRHRCWAWWRQGPHAFWCLACCASTKSGSYVGVTNRTKSFPSNIISCYARGWLVHQQHLSSMDQQRGYALQQIMDILKFTLVNTWPYWILRKIPNIS